MADGMVDGHVSNRDRQQVLEHYLEKIAPVYNGLYAAVEHKGSYLSGIGNSYSLILDNWAASNPRYTMADDPAIEVYATPPGQCAPEELACTILVPLN